MNQKLYTLKISVHCHVVVVVVGTKLVNFMKVCAMAPAQQDKAAEQLNWDQALDFKYTKLQVPGQ